MRVLRIYFTTYDEELFSKICECLKKLLKGKNIIVHRSIVVPEFRYVEVIDFNDDPISVKDNIEKKFKVKVKVDVIEKIVPSRRDKS